jgi:hypothetical protein
MKTEQIRVATEVKSNIEVGSILVREVDITYKPPPIISATESLNCVQPSP